MVTTIVAFAAFGLSVLHMVLKFVAPKTDTTIDDKIDEIVETVLGYLGQEADTVTDSPKPVDPNKVDV